MFFSNPLLRYLKNIMFSFRAACLEERRAYMRSSRTLLILRDGGSAEKPFVFPVELGRTFVTDGHAGIGGIFIFDQHQPLGFV